MPAAVVLAGGRGMRLGGVDKALVALAGRPMLAHVLDRLRPQAAPLAINANGDARRFAAFGLQVIADEPPGALGPLAGILAAMGWAASLGLDDVLTVPCDTPFLPGGLVRRLAEARGGAAVACARSAGRAHPVIALWRVGRREALREALLVEGVRKVEDWSARQGAVAVPFAADPEDPFLNLNTRADIAEAERRLSLRSAG